MAGDATGIDLWFAHALARALAAIAPEGPDAVPPQQPVEQVAARLRFHGIAGLLAADVAGMAVHPPWLAKAIADEARMQRLWEDTHRQLLLPVVAGLAAAGIPPLLLKGTALAYGVYPDPAMRARGDSDLLVSPDRLSQARNVLRQAGFVRSSHNSAATHQEDWWADSGFGMRHGIDLHWRTSSSAAMEAIVPARELLASRQPLPRFSPEACAPALVHTFLQVHINQFAHSANGYILDGTYVQGSDRLGWTVDVHLIAKSLTAQEWSELTQISLATGVAPSVAASLRRAG